MLPPPPKLLLSSAIFQPQFFSFSISLSLFPKYRYKNNNNNQGTDFFNILIIIKTIYTIFLFWKIVANSDGSMHRHGILGGHGRCSVTFVSVFLQASSVVLGPGLGPGPGVSEEGKKAP